MTSNHWYCPSGCVATATHCLPSATSSNGGTSQKKTRFFLRFSALAYTAVGPGTLCKKLLASVAKCFSHRTWYILTVSISVNLSFTQSRVSHPLRSPETCDLLYICDLDRPSLHRSRDSTDFARISGSCAETRAGIRFLQAGSSIQMKVRRSTIHVTSRYDRTGIVTGQTYKYPSNIAVSPSSSIPHFVYTPPSHNLIAVSIARPRCLLHRFAFIIPTAASMCSQSRCSAPPDIPTRSSTASHKGSVIGASVSLF